MLHFEHVLTVVLTLIAKSNKYHLYCLPSLSTSHTTLAVEVDALVVVESVFTKWIGTSNAGAHVTSYTADFHS